MGDDAPRPIDGAFAKNTYNCIGEPYKDPSMKGTHGETKGTKQFLTAPPKKGQTANAIGYGPLEFKPLYEAGKDPYEDPHKMYARARMKNREAHRTPNGFGYSSPMKRSSSPGDINATFRGVIEHLPDGSYPARGNREKIEKDVIASKNVITNPSKRGGFGVPGTLIGGNFEYKDSPYDAYGNSIRQDKKAHRDKMGEKKAFISTARRVECFDSNQHCAASSIYSLEGVTLRNPDKLDTVTPKERAEIVLEQTKGSHGIFKPSSPPKAGLQGTLNSFTEHMEDPFNEKTFRRAQMPGRRMPVAEQMSQLPPSLKERKAFRPSSTPRTSVVRSVATMNIRV